MCRLPRDDGVRTWSSKQTAVWLCTLDVHTLVLKMKDFVTAHKISNDKTWPHISIKKVFSVQAYVKLKLNSGVMNRTQLKFPLKFIQNHG